MHVLEHYVFYRLDGQFCGQQQSLHLECHWFCLYVKRVRTTALTALRADSYALEALQNFECLVLCTSCCAFYVCMYAWCPTNNGHFGLDVETFISVFISGSYLWEGILTLSVCLLSRLTSLAGRAN